MTQPAVNEMRTRTADSDVLLDVRGLRTYFHVMDGTVKAVDGVDFKIRRGGTLGLVGESGCGKSVTAHTIMRLIETPPGEIADGEIWFDGRDLLTISGDEMRDVRGNDIAMVFQEPMTSLNPVFTVGDQIAEAITLHQDVNGREARKRAVESLKLVGLSAPERRARQYPHELSGGMRQRVMIAMALSCNPKLLIADEPTTALDVTIQAQILSLLDSLKREFKMAILLITHDMGVIAGRADRVAVMYAGKIVEEAGIEELFSTVRHPYTEALLQSIPKADQDQSQPLYSIPGIPPDLSRPPAGCRFNPRCRYATNECKNLEPSLDGDDSAHVYACYHPVGGARPSRAVREAAAAR